MYVRTMSPKSTKRHRTGSGERSDDPPGCRHLFVRCCLFLLLGIQMTKRSQMLNTWCWMSEVQWSMR